MWSDLIPIEVWKKMREQGIACLEKKMDSALVIPYSANTKVWYYTGFSIVFFT